ncbi:hypothetical protein BJ742DRAFT_318289 [Cladochytrium replicatum]|nr:hypothetical protein BJ742DRAFT_318289 [Cladochytrium replicatum]
MQKVEDGLYVTPAATPAPEDRLNNNTTPIPSAPVDTPMPDVSVDNDTAPTQQVPSTPIEKIVFETEVPEPSTPTPMKVVMVSTPPAMLSPPETPAVESTPQDAPAAPVAAAASTTAGLEIQPVIGPEGVRQTMESLFATDNELEGPSTPTQEDHRLDLVVVEQVAEKVQAMEIDEPAAATVADAPTDTVEVPTTAVAEVTMMDDTPMAEDGDATPPADSVVPSHVTPAAVPAPKPRVVVVQERKGYSMDITRTPSTRSSPAVDGIGRASVDMSRSMSTSEGRKSKVFGIFKRRGTKTRAVSMFDEELTESPTRIHSPVIGNGTRHTMYLTGTAGTSTSAVYLPYQNSNGLVSRQNLSVVSDSTTNVSVSVPNGNGSSNAVGRPSFQAASSYSETYMNASTTSSSVREGSINGKEGSMFGVSMFNKTPKRAGSSGSSLHNSPGGLAPNSAVAAKLKYHNGPLDRRALTSKAPQLLIIEIAHVLEELGLIVSRADGDMKLKVIRPRRSESGSPNGVVTHGAVGHIFSNSDWNMSVLTVNGVGGEEAVLRRQSMAVNDDTVSFGRESEAASVFQQGQVQAAYPTAPASPVPVPAAPSSQPRVSIDVRSIGSPTINGHVKRNKSKRAMANVFASMPISFLKRIKYMASHGRSWNKGYDGKGDARLVEVDRLATEAYLAATSGMGTGRFGGGPMFYMQPGGVRSSVSFGVGNGGVGFGEESQMTVTSFSQLGTSPGVSRLSSGGGDAVSTRSRSSFVFARQGSVNGNGNGSVLFGTAAGAEDVQFQAQQAQQTQPLSWVGGEVRFTVEIHKIKNLAGLYVVDFKRVRGDIWGFKRLYLECLPRLPLQNGEFVI